MLVFSLYDLFIFFFFLLWETLCVWKTSRLGPSPTSAARYVTDSFQASLFCKRKRIKSFSLLGCCQSYMRRVARWVPEVLMRDQCARAQSLTGSRTHILIICEVWRTLWVWKGKVQRIIQEHNVWKNITTTYLLSQPWLLLLWQNQEKHMRPEYRNVQWISSDLCVGPSKSLPAWARVNWV